MTKRRRKCENHIERMPEEIVQHIYSFLDGYYDTVRRCWIARVRASLPDIIRPSVVMTILHGRENIHATLRFERSDRLFYSELRKTVKTDIEYIWSYYEKNRENDYGYRYTGTCITYITDNGDIIKSGTNVVQFGKI